MDESGQVFGCFISIVGIVLLVWAIIVGGYWRTDVVYSILDESKATNVSVLKQTFKTKHWVCGLIKGRQVDISNVLAQNSLNGKKVYAITVQTKHSVVDMLLTGITLCIYAPVTVTVEAKIGQ